MKLTNNMISGFDIICISTSDWKCPWGSRQQIMSKLSSKNRVLFVEYQMSILHFLKYPELLSERFTSRIRYVNDNLIVYRPLVNLPFRYYSKIINLLNQWLLLLQLKWLSKQLKFSKIILWIFEPTSYFLVGRLKESISVYYCIDFFKNEKSSYLRKRCIENMEKRLCKKCNIIFTSTDELLLDKVNLNKEIHLIPSAVNESFFDIDKDSLSLSVPEVIKNIPRPRIGFVGTLDDRIDYELTNFIARNHNDWAIVLVGLADNRKVTKYLKEKRNIHMLGWRDNNLLPVYINSFDICIIPYKINEFTKGIFPIKLFEYLALGKPVVSTRLPALERYKDVIAIADTKEDFIRDIALSLEEKGNELVNKRLKLAQENTWYRRLEIISKLIEECLKTKKTQDTL